MPSTAEDKQLKGLMAQVFPGYEAFGIDSVTPSITGGGAIVSFLIVCNEEASCEFRKNEELAVEVVASLEDSLRSKGKDLNLRFEFSFPLFSLQFFTTVEAENAAQQRNFAHILTEIDSFVIWLVDKDKNLLKVLQVKWDKKAHKKILAQITKE